jgi:hypothetical protein
VATIDRWGSLGRVMALGAAYDFVFAVAILGFTRAAARWLGLAVPEDPVYLALCGVLLTILAGVYARRYAGVAPLSAAGRTLGFLLFVWAWRGGRPEAFLALASADLALAAVTVLAWARARNAEP